MGMSLGRPRSTLTVLAVVLMTPGAAMAQEAIEAQTRAHGASTLPSIDTGARVRLRTAESRTIVGSVEALTAEVLVLRPDDRTASVSMPIASLSRIEISRGPRSCGSAAWRGARYGALIGVLAGAISLGVQHEQVGTGGSSAGKAAALGGWSGGLFGGLIGAAIGSAHRGEQWEALR